MFGELVFDDGRSHRGLFAQVHGARGERTRRVHQVGVTGDARECFFHRLEFADRQFELPPDARVSAGGTAGKLARADRQRRQGNRAAGGQRLHQHAPTLADALAPADDPIERNENIFAPVGAVLKRDVERIMARADFHAGRVCGNERQCNTEFFLFTEQMLRVEQPEGEPEHRGHGPERDVALLPVEADAEHIFFALKLAAAHHPTVGHGAGVTAGLGAGQRETRDFRAARQTRQIVFLLFIGTVMQQQFRRAQRIRHHHRDRGGDRTAGDLHDHRGMRLRGEFEPAVRLRDDHAEETLLLEVAPHRRRQVAALVRDLPVVEHRAQLLDRPVEKRLLRVGQPRQRQTEQIFPIRIAAEQLRFPPHGSGLERFAFGIGHRRHDIAQPAKQRGADQRAAQRRHHQRENDDEKNPPGNERHGSGGMGDDVPQGNARGQRRGPDDPGDARGGQSPGRHDGK